VKFMKVPRRLSGARAQTFSLPIAGGRHTGTSSHSREPPVDQSEREI
jgi:hypothetical protein